MLRALSRLSRRRHVPLESVPGRSALRRFGELARPAARAAAYLALAVGVVAAASLAVVHAAALAPDMVGLLAVWSVAVAATAAAPGVAAWVLETLTAR